MTNFRWFAGISLISVFLFILICNVALVLGWFFRQKRSSLVLVVGGLAGLVGFRLLPLPTINRWFWVPMVLDIAVPYGLGLVLSVGQRLLRLGAKS